MESVTSQGAKAPLPSQLSDPTNTFELFSFLHRSGDICCNYGVLDILDEPLTIPSLGRRTSPVPLEKRESVRRWQISLLDTLGMNVYFLINGISNVVQNLFKFLFSGSLDVELQANNS